VAFQQRLGLRLATGTTSRAGLRFPEGVDLRGQTWLNVLTVVKRTKSKGFKTASTVTYEGEGSGDGALIPKDANLFGRYRYVAQVGLGGGGSVHQVTDATLLRQVALKILDPAHVHKPRQVRRFLHEAQITSQLDHPNIVPVHDLAGAPSYYTMKLVMGTTLADWITASSGSGRSPAILQEMVGALVKVCDALAFAHSRGIVHCDIKPSNIMVGEFGQVYLMDWGSVHMEAGTRVEIDGEPVPPRPGRMIGTPAFMSPEQVAGAHERLDQRTDVFGVGALLYNILMGEAPFEADSLQETLVLARSSRLRKPAREAPQTGGLWRIVERAMARKPADRYPTIVALKRDLEEFIKGGYQLPTRTYAAGAPIVREGERGDEVFIIEQGTCEVTKKVGRKHKVLRQMGTGGVFGETAALAGGLRTATVTAVDEVRVRIVSKKILDEYLGPDTWISALVVALAQRFRAAEERISHLEGEGT
jgi:serine/threonine-protein kinase